MLFEVDRFEQFFSQQALAKGFNLYRKNTVTLRKKNSAYSLPFFVNKHQLVLKKKGTKVLSFSCSCGKKTYCEHLAATMFFLQADQLSHILQDGKKRGPAKRPQARDQFRISSTEALTVCAKYLKTNVLDEREVSEVSQLITTFLKRHRLASQSFFAHLGVLGVLIRLLQKRTRTENNGLTQNYASCLEYLDRCFKKGLDAAEKRAWFQATLYSLGSNKHLQMRTFEFLLPRFLSMSKNPIELDELETVLNKRKFKLPYTDTISPLLIARKQLAFKTGTQTPGTGSAESVIAMAELYLYEQKTKKVFQLLDSAYESIRKNHPDQYRDYLLYLLKTARALKDKERELKYLGESFVHRPFISESDLDRYMVLAGKKGAVNGILTLVERLKSGQALFTNDKINMLLLKGRMYDELIGEIQKQGIRFTLLHQAMMLKLPMYTPENLHLYVHWLTKTVQGTDSFSRRQKLFDQAEEYASRLPEEASRELIRSIAKLRVDLGVYSEMFGPRLQFNERKPTILQEEK